MEWEKLYRDDVSSIYIKDNRVVIEDGMKITLKTYATHDIASFEARVIMVGFQVRYDKAHGIERDFKLDWDSEIGWDFEEEFSRELYSDFDREFY